MPGEIQPSPSKLAHQAQDTSLAHEIQKRVCAFVFNHILRGSQRKHRLTFNASSETITMRNVHYIDSEEKKLTSESKLLGSFDLALTNGSYRKCLSVLLEYWEQLQILEILENVVTYVKPVLPKSKVTAQAKPLCSPWRFSIGHIVVWHKPTLLVVLCALCWIHMSCYCAFTWELGEKFLTSHL